MRPFCKTRRNNEDNFPFGLCCRFGTSNLALPPLNNLLRAHERHLTIIHTLRSLLGMGSRIFLCPENRTLHPFFVYINPKHHNKLCHSYILFLRVNMARSPRQSFTLPDTFFVPPLCGRIIGAHRGFVAPPGGGGRKGDFKLNCSSNASA